MKKTTLTKAQLNTLQIAHDKSTFCPQDLPFKGGAAKKVIDSLLNKQLITPIQRSGWVDYALTPTGQQLIGVEPAETDAAPPTTRPRLGSKLEQVIKLLTRKKGATIAQIMEQTGWQRHTVRGIISGNLKKRLGLNIISEKPEGQARIYRITEPEEVKA